jgi:predicted nucleic acid-binding protein
MQTMRSEGITDVLTNDAHFDQEGFRAVLRESRQAG